MNKLKTSVWFESENRYSRNTREEQKEGKQRQGREKQTKNTYVEKEEKWIEIRFKVKRDGMKYFFTE